jgi:hypothetical protein
MQGILPLPSLDDVPRSWRYGVTSPFGDKPVNPYAPSAPTPDWEHASGVLTRDEARLRLLGPAVGILMTVAVGVVFLLMFLLGIVVDPKVLRNMPNEQGFGVFLVLIFVGGLLAHLVQLVGGIAMLRVRGQMWAMLAVAASFIPCNFYCCWLAFPFAVWGAIVLANPDVRAAFERK